MKSLVKHFMFLALIVLGATGVWAQTNNTIDLSTVTSDITVNNGYTLTGTLGANKKISIADGATVTLNNVTINGVDNGSYNWAGITCNGNATLILVGENTVKGFNSDRPGIYVPENSTLTIQGSGSLTASSNGNGVGIGGDKSGSGGNIIIAGGTITATGGNECAGIGGGQGGSCGNISITSGIVIATGGNSASGIGGGQGGSCGNISITGGTVTATGGNSAPGIGGGGSSCNINISGGMVTATGGNSAPGIGGKQSGGCGTITIANTVTGVRAVKGGNSPHSIGAGQGGGCGTVTVNGNVSDGISTSPYSYPSYTLDDIPTGWTVKADNQTVSVTDGVASIPVGATVVLTPPTPDKPRVKDVELLSPEEIPLTFEAKEAGAVVKFKMANVVTELVKYSTDGITWKTYKSDSAIVLTNIGDKVSFHGHNASYANDANAASTFSCSADCYIYGNVMSLINEDNFANITTLDASTGFSFCKLFYNNTHIYIHDTKPLLLPATQLNNYCYYFMFSGCSNLTQAPVLPASTLAVGCYHSMFSGCDNLIVAPKLPSMTMAVRCYKEMFKNCINLTTAPELPAPTLVDSCYETMFYGCTNLNSVICLATDISATNCTNNWLNNVAATGTFIKPSSMNDWTIGPDVNGEVNGIPTGWIPTDVMYFTPLTFEAKTAGAQVTFTKATIIDNLSIEYSTDGTTWSTYTEPIALADSGNKVSFRGNNATYATYNNDYIYSYFSCSADCYIYGNIMSLINKDNFANTTKLTKNYTFYKLFENNDKIYYHGSKPLLLPATTLRNGCYWGMFSHCTQLTKAPALPATTLENFCYAYMFEGCTKLETAPALPATTLANNCYSFMFDGCTQLTTAPVLPATTLTVSCYRYMFNNCSHLNNVTCLATDISADDCTTYWLSGVASTGTFYKAASMTTWPTGPYNGNVDGIPSGWTVDDYYDPLATPLTFEAQTAGAVVRFTKGSSVTWTNIVEYSLNGGTWMTYTQGTDITLTNMGDKVSFRGNNAKYATSMSDIGAQYSKFSCTNNCYVYGNIMSLIDADDYPTMTVLTSDNEYAFCNLFTGNTNIYNHPSKTLVLPATTLAYRCYGRMFYGCSSLTSTPELLATTLAEGCCYQMFYGCSSLTSAPALLATTLADQCCYNMFHGCSSLSSAPALPATTLAPNCYALMFEGCSNLTSAPALPATTLASSCYSRMFQNCTSLSSAPALPATTLANYCYSSMFYGCSNLTSAPVLPATTLANHCYESMFQGCTILTSAPALPATTLSVYCYYLMFQGCSNLTSAPELPATTLAEDCYREMFKNCTSLTSAPVLPATTLASYCYYHMFQYCSNLNSVTCLATNISAYNCTTNWLYGVPDISTSTFTKASGIDAGGYGWPRSTSGIPSNWTVVSVLDLSTVTANTTVPNGCVVTGTLNGNYKISIADGATVTLSGVTINGTNSGSYSWAGLNCLGDATIILADGTTNTVKGFYEYYPGIHIPESSTLTIQGELAGTGTLNASSNGHGAGIGGGYNISCGNITISGGTVAATGGMDAAGIGSGSGSSTNPSSCGAITINGGTVEATGGMNAAGIGSGYRYSSCGAITISGGTVEARGDNNGAGIGSGYGSSCSTITINGGTVEATGGSNAVGIGSGGNSSSCGAITISGGTVEAKGSNAGAGIGSGYSSSCGDITIQNTVTRVTATKGSDSDNSIGAGYNSTCGTVTIGGVTGPISTSPYTYIPGALSGTFTINGSGDQVYFSQGNLRYTSGAWSFFDNQWDYYATYSADSWDKFGWSTSATTYGMSTSENNSDYSGDFVDWGATIGSGWRTLTLDEWTYVFNTRTSGSTVNGTSDARYTEATINTDGTSVNDMILFPDGITVDAGEATSWGNINSTSDWGTKCTSAQWTALAAKGCVFLPTAGNRSGTTVNKAGSQGHYRSSTPSGSDYAYYVLFYSGYLTPSIYNHRHVGYSVRLVRDAN